MMTKEHAKTLEESQAQWKRVEKIRGIIEETCIFHGAFQADVVLAFLQIICTNVTDQSQIEKIKEALDRLYSVKNQA